MEPKREKENMSMDKIIYWRTRFHFIGSYFQLIFLCFIGKCAIPEYRERLSEIWDFGVYGILSDRMKEIILKTREDKRK